MRRRLFAACIVLALGLAGLPSPASALTSNEAKFVSLINQERKERDVPTLVVKSDLVAIARKHSARMAEDGTIYHNDNLRNEVGGNWWTAGENVGRGPSVESLHDAFMSSPGHKANILDKHYNQIGVGVVVKDDTIYVTEVFAGRPTATKRVVVPSSAPEKAKPKPKKRPPAPVLTAPPRTIGMLLLLAGLDAIRVDPATGEALGV